jgi:anhydro-N-acetylmuramic acid kinase
VLVIGLMSGTSADGVDAALVEWPDGPETRPFRLVAFAETPFEPALQQRIHRLAAGRLPGGEVLRELAALDVALGERFAEAAQALALGAEVPLERVAAIASHGQTVAHHPELRATLQIGDPSVISERTGRPVVADFRPRDLAAGGEGAPLAPFFHLSAFADAREARVILNLGGIANVTWLPAGAASDAVLAFDVGPANTLIDAVVQLASDGAERFDAEGARAQRGRADEKLLEELLDDSFLRRPPPKSTGRERYGVAEAEALLARRPREPGAIDDLLATLVAFSAEAVARACRDFLPAAPERLIVGGGGARNPALMEALALRLGVPVEPMDAHGVPAAAAGAGGRWAGAPTHQAHVAVSATFRPVPARPGAVLEEADAYLMGRSRLQEAARALVRIFEAERIPYAIAGAIALGAHGRVRLTEDVDVLLRRDDLARFKRAWLGRDYVEPTPGLKAVRDTARGVRIDFLLTGEYPGDGKPKPIAFPDPATRATEADGLRVLELDALIELKLASGMTAAHRGQDLVDVMELIRARALPLGHAERLHEWVRDKYRELWQLAQVRDDY